MTLGDRLVDHHFLHVSQGRQVVHGVEQDAFHDGAQAAGAGLALHGLAGDRTQALFAILEVDAFHVEQALVLLGERVFRVLEDRHQGLFVELFEGRDHRQAADELGDETELDEVLGLDVVEDVGAVRPQVLLSDLGGEAHAALLGAVLDDLLETRKRAAHDEEDVGGIDLQKLLLRVLAPALGGHRGDRPLDQLEQRLLHALAGDVTSDRRVVGLARNLVDLVDVDDAGLCFFDVVVALLQQLLDDVFDVFANVTRFGQRGGIGDGEGHVEKARQRLGEQGLARAGGPDEQNIALGELDFILRLGAPLSAGLQPLVVVVDRDRQNLFGAFLADDVVVQDFLDFDRLRQLVAGPFGPVLEFFADDVVAELDALVADEHGGPGDELADLVLTLAAKGAIQKLAVVATAAIVTHAAVIAVLPAICPRDRTRSRPPRP